MPTWCWGVDHETSRTCSTTFKEENGHDLDTDITADEWREMIARYKAHVEEELGIPFPQDPHEQLWGAIGACFPAG
jgi:pyruvate,orthophosphate dikinase